MIESPFILSIQLKIFKNTMSSINGRAIQTKIAKEMFVQKQIDIGNESFMLLSAIIHIGKNIESGHFIAFGRSTQDCHVAWSKRSEDPEHYKEYGEWTYANDVTKRSMPISEVNNFLLKHSPKGSKNNRDEAGL